MLSRLVLLIGLIAGAMPALLNITITPKADGPSISLDICHAAQALDNAVAVVPMAAPMRIEERLPAPVFGAPPPYPVFSATGYIPDIDPPPPR
jgi:hypothetical protein